MDDYGPWDDVLWTFADYESATGDKREYIATALKVRFGLDIKWRNEPTGEVVATIPQTNVEEVYMLSAFIEGLMWGK
jgi:hypothetical protein